MEIIRGRRSTQVVSVAATMRAAGYREVLVDVGTGDGRFVRHVARSNPDWLAIGLDTCRDNLREESHKAPANALYVVADALALPEGLSGFATRATVNFPWGSLLRGLLDGDTRLLEGLRQLFREESGSLEIRLNASALAQEGWDLDTGRERVRLALTRHGFSIEEIRYLSREELRICPSTWAKRVAFGRDSSALYLRGSAVKSCRFGDDISHRRPELVPGSTACYPATTA